MEFVLRHLLLLMEFVSSYELLPEFKTTKMMALQNYGLAAAAGRRANSVLIIRVSSAHASASVRWA
jgi:hypothetical protein